MSALSTALIVSAIAGAAGSVGSAAIQAHAAGKAADTEADAAKQAMDYTKQATDKAMGIIGQQRAAAQMPGTYAAPTPFGAPGQPATMGAALSPTAMAPRPAFQNFTPAPPAQTILVQAPDGSQRRVDASLRDRVTAAGGKILG